MLADRRIAFYATLSSVVILLSITAPKGQDISADTYPRYALLEPDSHQFKIYYEVTETRDRRALSFQLDSRRQRNVGRVSNRSGHGETAQI